MRLSYCARIAVCLLLCVIGISTLQAQNKKYLKFGKVDPTEVAMETYEADPEAGAVILFEKEHVYFDYVKDKFQLVFVVHRRVKIFSSSETDQADVEIPYYSYNRREEVLAIKGITYNLENGQIVESKMSKDAVFQEDINAYFSQKKFAMPNVKDGSVIEYSYRITSQRNSYIPNWYFQHEIPAKMSQLMIDIPEGFQFERMYRGNPIESLSIDQATYRPDFIDVNGTRYIYTARDIPAMKLEAYTSTISNYVGRLKLELVGIYLPKYNYIEEFNTSWTGLSSTLLSSESYGSYLGGKRPVKDLLVQTNADPEDPSSFLGAVQGLVRNTLKWNGNRGYYPSENLREALNEKEGNGAAMNLLMVALLQEAGYKAHPALLSTRSHGAVQTFKAMSDQFNHMIAYVEVGENYVLLDATDGFCPAGSLPFADLNGKCFILDGQGSNWAKLQSPAKSKISYRGMMSIDSEGKVSGNLTIKDEGYDAVYWRKYLYKNDNDENEFLEARLMDDVPDAEIEEFKVQQISEIAEPLETKCGFASTQFADASGDFIYLQPLLMATMEENPFEKEERSYPVEFGALQERVINFTYTVPEGYEIETLPEPTRVVMPEKAASFLYNTASFGSNIQVMVKMTVDKDFFGPTEYADLRAFYDYVLKKHGEQIILHRKL
ncbi:MAG: DUF3857 domain-containing protein [Bacteroidota bacterium]